MVDADSMILIKSNYANELLDTSKVYSAKKIAPFRGSANLTGGLFIPLLCQSHNFEDLPCITPDKIIARAGSDQGNLPLS